MTVPDLVSSDFEELREYLWNMEADLENIQDNGTLSVSMKDELATAVAHIEEAREMMERRIERIN